MQQTLTCQDGNHTWVHESSRGRKPKFCPVHDPKRAEVAPVEITDANVEVLICQHGDHSWTRARARGRKAPYCPDHRPEVKAPVAVAQAATEAEDGSEATPTVKRPSIGGLTIRHPAVQYILDLDVAPGANNTLGYLRDKLCYTVGELESAGEWRETGDWNNVIESHRRFTLEAIKVYQAANRKPVEYIEEV
jgi:hypothetical protein